MHTALAASMVVAAFATAGGAAPAPIPVIIDTDIGDDVDDAFALALAVRNPRLDVIGVTTAFGDTATRVALGRRLLQAMARPDIPVAQGTATPDPTPFTQRAWAQEGTDHSVAPDAVDFIASAVSARPGEVTLLALAPLVNVETLIRRSPASFRRLKRIVMMGGSINAGYRMDGSGPTPPSAEYNVAQAPSALVAVLGGGVPVTMFPLDATQVRLEQAARDRLFAQKSATSDALRSLYLQWQVGNAWGQVTPTLFDVVPVAWLADPAVCAVRPLRVAVEAQGFTRVEQGEPNVQVCLDERGDAVRQILVRALMEGSDGDAR